MQGVSADLFVNKDAIPDELLCSICHDVALVEPKQCKNGHVFCKACITKWLEARSVCPIDRSALRADDLSDCLVVKAMISRLLVKCVNCGAIAVDGNAPDKRRVVNGCEWVGEYDKLETHCKECGFSAVTCAHGCGERLVRRDKAQHEAKCQFATLNCPQCAQDVKLRDMPQHVRVLCAKRIVGCTAGASCMWTGPFCNLKSHLDTCGAVQVACVVCEERMPRAQLQAHVAGDTARHLMQALTQLADLKQEVATLRADHGAITAMSNLITGRLNERPAQQLEGGHTWRVFDVFAPDADRSVETAALPFSNVACTSCTGSALQMVLVVERLRPQTLFQNEWGRWIGVRMGPGHAPSIKGQIQVTVEVFEQALENTRPVLTHRLAGPKGRMIDFDSMRGSILINEQGYKPSMGFVMLLTDIPYSKALGPGGSMFVRFKICVTEC